jgi:hypothetical protein
LNSYQIKEKIIKLNICCTLFIIILFASYQTVATEMNWVEIYPSPSPPSQKPWKLMYHPPSQDIILFGGKYSEGNYQALWSYNREETSWVEVEVSDWEIFPDMGWSMTYDSKNDVFITFGGGGMDGSLPVQTWTFNYSNKIWTNMSPSISPPPRIMSSLAYDTHSEKVIMFGGIDQFIGTNVLYHDTWTYDYLNNTWTNVTPSINPEGRGRANMVYDSTNDKVLLFGGFTEKPGDYVIGGLKQDTWMYDLETKNWTELFSPVKPPARAYHSMVYNSDINQTVIFGGDIDNLTPTSDTWLFDYLTNTW